MESMHAVRAHVRGGPEQLVYEEASRPQPRAGEALVRVRVAGVTGAELTWDATWVDRAGHDRLPTIPSHELAGSVAAVGHGVVNVAPGDEVFGLIEFDVNGAAADFVTVRARHLAIRPDAVDQQAAAALSLAGLSAWQALVEKARLTSGQRVLVLGGAGAVGSFAVQIAATLGCEVVTTASQRDLDHVRALGASVALDYRQDPFSAIAGTVDIVLDTVGEEAQRQSAKALRPGGTLVSLYGPLSSDVALPAGGRSLFFVVEPDAHQLADLADLVIAGRVRPQISRAFPLAETRQAYEFATGGHPRGKVLLTVS